MQNTREEWKLEDSWDESSVKLCDDKGEVCNRSIMAVLNDFGDVMNGKLGGYTGDSAKIVLIKDAQPKPKNLTEFQIL